ncbi:hypothetical protein RYX36_006149 [Vicia faba]
MQLVVRVQSQIQSRRTQTLENQAQYQAEFKNDKDAASTFAKLTLGHCARHGTRSPTKKRIKQLDDLFSSGSSYKRRKRETFVFRESPSWLNGWKSPWQGKFKGSELIRRGEEELYAIGIMVRDRFPSLFDEDYHPDMYHIKATQVLRFVDENEYVL